MTSQISNYYISQLTKEITFKIIFMILKLFTSIMLIFLSVLFSITTFAQSKKTLSYTRKKGNDPQRVRALGIKIF